MAPVVGLVFVSIVFCPANPTPVGAMATESMSPGTGPAQCVTDPPSLLLKPPECTPYLILRASSDPAALSEGQPAARAEGERCR